MPWSVDAQHKKQHRRKRNPCGSNKPTEVDNISGQYQRVEGTRNNLFRVRITWDRVTQTQAGEDYKPDAYGIQLWGSPDGETWDKDNLRHKQVRGSAGPDGDWGTEDDVKVPNFVVFRGIKPKWYYRVRVRALSKKECDGTFGSWITLGSANDNVNPPPPTDVRIFENSTGKRVVVDWEPPLDADDSEQVDQGVTFFQVQLSKESDFSPVYKFDRIQASSQRSFRIADADLGDSFYGRVRSIDAAGNKSAWIPARINGNSDPDAVAQAAGVGTTGGSGNVVLSFGTGSVVRGRLYESGWTADRPYRITKVRMRIGAHDPDAHPNDGTPTGGPIYANLRIYNAAETSFVKVFDSDSRLTVAAGTHKDSAAATDMTNTDIDEDETLAVKVSRDETNTFAGRGLTIHIVLEPR